jgi:uncharacterized protein
MKSTMLILSMLLVIGCTGCETQPTTSSAALSKENTTLCGESVTLEIARTSEEKTKGLMNRSGLILNSGMVFIYESEQQVTFWMKNVSFPISIGYFDSIGRLLGSDEMVAESPSTPDHQLKRYSSDSSNVIYAVEMSKNWFENRTDCILDLAFLN